MILVLFQIGGFGIMTGATLLGLLVTRQLRLSNRLLAQAETRTIALGDVAGLLRFILLVTISIEAAATATLALRLRYAYDEPWLSVIWNGLFHAISSFNAGFSTYSDNMMRFVADPVVIVAIHGGSPARRARVPCNLRATPDAAPAGPLVGPSACLTRLSTAGSGGVRAYLLRLAGCAHPTGSAG